MRNCVVVVAFPRCSPAFGGDLVCLRRVRGHRGFHWERPGGPYSRPRRVKQDGSGRVHCGLSRGTSAGEKDRLTSNQARPDSRGEPTSDGRRAFGKANEKMPCTAPKNGDGEWRPGKMTCKVLRLVDKLDWPPQDGGAQFDSSSGALCATTWSSARRYLVFYPGDREGR